VAEPVDVGRPDGGTTRVALLVCRSDRGNKTSGRGRLSDQLGLQLPIGGTWCSGTPRTCRHRLPFPIADPGSAHLCVRSRTGLESRTPRPRLRGPQSRTATGRTGSRRRHGEPAVQHLRRAADRRGGPDAPSGTRRHAAGRRALASRHRRFPPKEPIMVRLSRPGRKCAPTAASGFGPKAVKCRLCGEWFQDRTQAARAAELECS
jgi:hypothetical protein